METYKTAICSLNAKYIHASLAPWCLYEGVKKYTQNVRAKVIEGTVNEKEESVLKKLLAEDFDAVGFCCYIWNIERVISLSRKLKKANKKVKIIFGGPEVSFNAKEVLQNNEQVDFVVSGEGEEAFAKLLQSLFQNEDIEDGIASYRRDGKIVCGKYNIFTGEVSPYSKEYLSALNGRISYIEASRGCPFSCSFCLSGSEKNVRFFPLDKVKKEMLILANSGSQTVKFVDRTFNCNKKRAVEILNFIKENYGKDIPPYVCFHFEIAADLLDSEMLFAISQMPKGSVQFEVGIQSFNEKTLEKINRKTNLDKLCKNVRTLVSYGNCHIHTDLIAGLPYENFASFKESFNKAYALEANMLQLGFLKILHGSSMEKTTDKYVVSYSNKPPYEVKETPWLSEKEMEYLSFTEDALERLYNSARFKRTLKYIFETVDIAPFDLFFTFGEYVAKKNVKMPALDLYTSWVYEYFSSLGKIDSAVLRDKMITDRILTNSSGIIPHCLRIEDKRLSKVKYRLSKQHPETKGVKRSVAILYTENSVLFCDYENCDKISLEYPYGKVDLEI